VHRWCGLSAAVLWFTVDQVTSCQLTRSHRTACGQHSTPTRPHLNHAFQPYSYLISIGTTKWRDVTGTSSRLVARVNGRRYHRRQSRPTKSVLRVFHECVSSSVWRLQSCLQKRLQSHIGGGSFVSGAAAFAACCASGPAPVTWQRTKSTSLRLREASVFASGLAAHASAPSVAMLMSRRGVPRAQVAPRMTAASL
jgi:hypothetical protein